ncbi:MAG TPA: CsgG/HfaB family protein [Bacteroidales bacterium]|nr:CsgG/HfaB family protein [Bacteroidales bacterium]HPF01682.1 CsgG/HfaB family protein [Bacteroidales bacterium]HPJ58691.1 CsgG/HfaB family protein [Bacteroidales bacterium]HPR12378.1 CsgG/HfaB family protein [Bacteroidales bacterium]HRW84598.1 CsgG/HfaB family protein [Bacteroidales bacterium]
MYRQTLVFLLAGILSGVSANSHPAIRSVAVTEFSSNGFTETYSWIGGSCADVIIDRISSDKSIRVVEREQLSRIIEELKLQMGGLVNSEAVVETGNLIGVTYFITGSISKFDEQVILSSRSYSVETGEILSTNTIRGLLKDLFTLQEEMASKISSDLKLITNVEGGIHKPLQNFELYQKTEYLKKMAESVPVFNLDPRRKIRTSEYLNSIRQCDELIAANNDYYLPHYYKGLFAMHLGEFEIAGNETRIATELSSHNYEALILRASVFFNSGNTQEAEALLEEITEHFPELPEGWFLLSKVQTAGNANAKATESLVRSLLGRKIMPQALAGLRSGLSISPPASNRFSSESLYNVARLYEAFWSKGREPAEIVNIARLLNEQYPDFYLPLFFIGRAEYKSKKYDGSVNSFLECLSYYPQFPEAHRDLALSLFSLKNCDRAEQHVRLYMQFSDAVTDYDIIEEARKKCK